MTLRERYIFARALLVSVGGSWWRVLIFIAVIDVALFVALFVALLDVGVVAIVGLEVDRGYVLEFLLLGYTYP